MLPQAADRTTSARHVVNPQDPSTWLAPGQQLLDDDGRDWSWAYVIYERVAGYPAYCVGTNGSAWTRWVRRGRRIKGAGTYVVLSTNWRRLSESPNADGYINLILYRDGKRRQVHAHTLVLETFVGPRPSGAEGAHWNGDPGDNRLSNLRWASRKENAADKARHGRAFAGVSRLGDEDILVIRQRVASGEPKESVARDFGVLPRVVRRVVNRETFKHVS